jgi:Glycosyl transferase 4-like domain
MTLTRRVVLVAPEFPPYNSAGAHRPRLFAKHLAALGWKPTVLTVRHEEYEGPLDPALELLINSGIDVVRTGALPIKPVRIIGDLGLRSLVPHARRLFAIARRGDADAAVLFGPPWFSFALGPYVLRRAGVPYIVDYIDPWISDWTAAHAFPRKGWFYHQAAAALEPAVLRSATHITAVSGGILDDLRKRYSWLDPSRMTAMPYGAEPDDLAASAGLGVDPPDFTEADGSVTVAFTGAIQPTSAALVDVVLRAVRRVRASGTPLGQRLRLRCYGTSNLTWGHRRHAVLPAATALGVADCVSEIPERIPYLQAMAVLRACDIVLVMGSTDSYYHASKLYPAMVSGRPVLGLCHRDSSIRRVVEDTGAGRCVTFRDVEEVSQLEQPIADAIVELAARGRAGIAVGRLEPFTARQSTRVLAAILERAAAPAPLAEAI